MTASPLADQGPAKEPVGAPEFLAVVEAFVRELHHARGDARSVRLDSALDRELGIDSLGRAELALRIERAFGASLSERAISKADTPADLLRSLQAVRGDAGAVGAADAAALAWSRETLAAAEAAPSSSRTLLEVLDWHAERHPERRHLTWLPSEGAAEPLAYAALRERVDRVAAALLAAGVGAGTTVAIMLPSGLEYFAAFLGVQRAGAIPVPLYPPARRSQLEDHLRRQVGILRNAEAELLVTFAEALPFARALVAQAPRLLAVRDVVELSAAGAAVSSRNFPAVAGGDVAFLQYTSGSTGDPKGVVLSHANLLANLRAIGKVLAIGGDDVVVSWLPLYHDMGLIGAWMGSLYFGVPLALMAPSTFLTRPARWLEAIHRYGGTLSAAPNFAYELCLQRVSDEALATLGPRGLASWRVALNGAEPVGPGTMARFAARFAAAGFRAEALLPVYGLAENSLAVAFPPPGRGVRVDVVERRALQLSGRAVPVAAGEPGAGSAEWGQSGGDSGERNADSGERNADSGERNADSGEALTLGFVSCGLPLPGLEVRVVDAAGRELGDREQGRLQFRGPSATAGYHRNPQATARLRQGDWLDSGDLAYLAAGEVYITGRAKDLIIRAGRNIYPQEIEAAVGELPGVRKGFVAVFAAADPGSGSERLVVVAETRERDPAARAALSARITSLTADLAGTPPDEVLLAPPHTVPKTSSGKIRRAASRELFERGEFEPARARAQPQRSWLLGSAGSALLQRARALSATVYAGYFWALFALAVPPVWLGVALLPGLERRRRFARRAARILAAATGIRLHSVGPLDPPPAGAVVYVANHMSYLDSFVLTALLPPRASYVAKRELDANPFTRVPLRRLGALFVERFDREQSAADARSAVAALRSGQSLVIFAEGTFRRAPGLLPFRMGAFVAAAEAGVPVAPIALRGTRSLLRGDGWFPRRGEATMVIESEITPHGAGWAAALALRDATRAAILRHCGEPDVAALED